MLVLRRRRGETICIGGDLVKITVTELTGQYVKLGIEAPTHLKVHRGEVQDRIDQGEPKAAAARVQGELRG